MPGGPPPRQWRPDEDSLLRRMVADGASWSAIGRALDMDRRLCKGRHAALLEAPDPPRPTRERKCLCCGRPFLSEGAHNRLCDPCRDGAGEITHGLGGVVIHDGGISGIRITAL